MVSKVTLVILFLTFKANLTVQWNAPSFISAWQYIEANTTGELVVVHGLNEVPVKVDVQIKIVKNDVDYIFTGSGTAHRDNGYPPYYGGVVYAYSSTDVIIYMPTVAANGESFGGVAYTGSSEDYVGPDDIRGWYSSGFARVRAWKAADFPSPAFTKTFPIDDTDSGCFVDQVHESNSILDFVIAQVNIGGGYFTEGQGNIFQHDTALSDYGMGGVLFGFDDQNIRMWSPTGNGQPNPWNGAVYVRHNGWGVSNTYVDSGEVTLKGYIVSNAFRQSITVSQSQVAASNLVNFGNSYSLDSALVLVQFQENENSVGNNDGMFFNGAGSAMITHQTYSGVVYVYTNESALLYTPSSDRGYMIYIDGRWGMESKQSSEKTANMRVTVFATGPSCPDPGVTTATYTLSNGLEPGSNVTYTCNPNHQLMSGNLNRNCKTDGTWSGVAPYCASNAVTCPEPRGLNNTKVTATNGLQVGSVIKYTCAYGYVPTSGSMIRNCTSNGTWSGSEPICSVVYCDDPSVNFTIHTLTNGLQHTSMVQYNCITDYVFTSGSSWRYCDNGTWIGTPPVCTEKPCNDPGPVWNAGYTSSGFSVGSQVIYTCNTNSVHKAGNLTRTCGFGGYWSGMPPVCIEQTCHQPETLVHSSFNYTGLTTGSSVTYMCDSGFFSSSGDLLRTCQSDGTWTGSPPYCSAIVCTVPVDVASASYSITSLWVGGQVNYICDPGYGLLSGNLTSTCDITGQWSGIQPVCTAVSGLNCSDPTVNFATHTLSFGLQSGSVVNYTCNTGYVYTSGYLTRTCKTDGSWDGSPPICSQQTCYQPESLIHGSVNNTGLTVGSGVKYFCDPGYSKYSGDLFRTCQPDGSWTGTPPFCTAIMCPIPVDVTSASYSITSLEVGGQVVYTCDSGYDLLSGNLTRTCNITGQWDKAEPVCTAITCSVPVDVSDASFSITCLGVGGQVIYTCDPGYGWLSGNLTRTCDINGQWDGEEPTCTAVSGLNCSDPTVNFATHTLSSGLQTGSIVNYTCNTGYVYTSGYPTRTCQFDGSWDGSNPICSEKPCTDPGPVSNADYSYTGLSVGSQVIYTCYTNSVYKAGNLTRTCEFGGTWSGLSPVCLEITCVDPGSVYNTTYAITGLHPGDTAIYTCNSASQQQAGDNIRVCQADGTWSGIPIVCGSGTSCSANTPVVYSPETLVERLEETKKELAIEKKETGAFKRTLICAKDPRPSAKYLGFTGVAVLGSIVMVIIISDVLTLVTGIGRRPEKKK